MVDIPRALSGRGRTIYEKMIAPLLRTSYQYDRVTSYYSPRSLAVLLEEIANVWRKGGTIRLVIGFHQTMEITPALRNNTQISEEVKKAVAKAMMGQIDDLRQNLGSEKTHILSVLREIINQKGLHVLLVTPKVNFEFYKQHGTWPNPEIGIFHSKFSIIHHDTAEEEENSILEKLRARFRRFGHQYYRPPPLRGKTERYSLITGSMNESVRGYSENIEDSIHHRSWIEAEKEVCEYFLDRFEKIWLGHDLDVVSMPFTEAFVDVIKSIDRETTLKRVSWSGFRKTVSDSVLYHGLAFPDVGLLPHQIAVYRTALSRWPIRVLLADEVGLGKTIEAGSIISYLMKHNDVRRVMILTPASLRRQWQKELKILFGLDFWVYNSGKRVCEIDEKEFSVGAKPLAFKGDVDNVIVSWHWARIGISEGNLRFDVEDLPDLLIVDEAHHARIHEEDSGDRPTQLHTLLTELQKDIPHVVLLTATPFQTDILDYYSLLEILGVPEGFRDDLQYFSRWIRGEIPRRSLQTRKTLLQQMHRFIDFFELTNLEARLGELRSMRYDTDPVQYQSLAMRTNEVSETDVISTHPTTLLATRNYRSNLAEVGYHFPDPHMHGPGIKINEMQKQLFADIDEFISQRLGTPEKLRNSTRTIGLMRSMYRQRIVSSVKAALDTLNRRKEKLETFLEDGPFSSLEPDESEREDADLAEEADALPYLKYGLPSKDALEATRIKAKAELYSLKRLISQIEKQFKKGPLIVDPKMQRLRDLVKEHTSAGRKVLVFSRYTSTTSSIIDSLNEFIGTVGVGRFDGTMVGTYRVHGRQPVFTECTRKEIVNHLKSGRIQILVCSDAASEGLNLHSANVAINVDVPWNPARLLQRFGRVDRLGQKADDVYLVNLYYPGTIEERMYSVLEDRRLDFRAVLGEVPEIMSEPQKKAISDLGAGVRPMINITFEEVGREREEMLKNRILGIKTANVGDLAKRSPYLHLTSSLKSEALRDGKSVIEHSQSIIEIDGYRVSMDPLDDDFLGLVNPELSRFEVEKPIQGKALPVHQIVDGDRQPLAFAVVDDERWHIISSDNWSSVFRFIFEGKPIDLSLLTTIEGSNTDAVLEELLKSESWVFPDHSAMSCLFRVETEKPSELAVKLGPLLGYIEVIR